MKKSTIWITASLLFMIFIPSLSSQAATVTKPTPTHSVSASDAAEVKAIMARLDEIKAMDKSRLSSSEKKQLRKEVRASRERMKEVGGGVYISAGVIIIILLLIILL